MGSGYYDIDRFYLILIIFVLLCCIKIFSFLTIFLILKLLTILSIDIQVISILDLFYCYWQQPNGYSMSHKAYSASYSKNGTQNIVFWRCHLQIQTINHFYSTFFIRTNWYSMSSSVYCPSQWHAEIKFMRVLAGC